MCHLIVDLDGLSRSEVYDRLSMGAPVVARAPGWAFQFRVGGGADIVRTPGRSVLVLSVMAVDSFPRRALNSQRGVRVALIAGRVDPNRPPRIVDAGISRLRLQSDRTWSLEFESCAVCAHNEGACGYDPMLCWFCHMEAHDTDACKHDPGTCVLCHVDHWSTGCGNSQCPYCLTHAAA